MDRLEKEITEAIDTLGEEYEDRMDRLGEEIIHVRDRLTGHIGGETKQRNRLIRENNTDPPAKNNNDDEDKVDDSVKAYIEETGEDPRNTLMRLIRKGKWKESPDWGVS